MARKKKRRGGAEDEPEFRLPKAPERLASPFADALKGMKPAEKSTAKAAAHAPVKRGASTEAAPPAPAAAPKSATPQPPKYSYEDRVAFNRAFSGVRPLAKKKAGERLADPGVVRPEGEPPRRAAAGTGTPAETEREEVARARLAQLVAGGIRFDVDRDEDGHVVAARVGTSPTIVGALRAGRARPDASIDLHGMRADEAEREVVRFVREHHRRGDRLLRVVHGKGLHSDGGAGVLGDRVVHALSEGGAAPFVQAFCTAPPHDGGTGCLLVQLAR